jgi:hypothetical protein
MWGCIHIQEFYAHLQNSLTHSWKLTQTSFRLSLVSFRTPQTSFLLVAALGGATTFSITTLTHNDPICDTLNTSVEHAVCRVLLILCLVSLRWMSWRCFRCDLSNHCSKSGLTVVLRKSDFNFEEKSLGLLNKSHCCFSCDQIYKQSLLWLWSYFVSHRCLKSDLKHHNKV